MGAHPSKLGQVGGRSVPSPPSSDQLAPLTDPNPYTHQPNPTDTIDVASIHFPTPLDLYSAPPYLSSTPLISLTPSPSTLLVPLTSSLHSSTPPVFPPNPFPKHHDIPPWLTPFTIQLQTHVVASPEEILEFVKRSWSGQKVDVRVVMDTLEISGVEVDEVGEV